jgi:hypothetical protein
MDVMLERLASAIVATFAGGAATTIVGVEGLVWPDDPDTTFQLRSVQWFRAQLAQSSAWTDPPAPHDPSTSLSQIEFKTLAQFREEVGERAGLETCETGSLTEAFVPCYHPDDTGGKEIFRGYGWAAQYGLNDSDEDSR